MKKGMLIILLSLVIASVSSCSGGCAKNKQDMQVVETTAEGEVEKEPLLEASAAKEGSEQASETFVKESVVGGGDISDVSLNDDEDAPSVSFHPTATKEPVEETKESVAVVETAAPTASPVVTKEPVKTPKPTEAPIVTQTPKETEAPIVVQTPKPTEAPIATAPPKPLATQKPADHTHSYEKQTVSEATCKAAKVVVDVCTICGDRVNERSEGGLGAHKFPATGIIYKEAKCEIPGEYIKYCEVCGVGAAGDPVAPLGHDWELTKHTVGDCMSPDYDNYLCKRCGQTTSIADDSTSKDRHDFRIAYGTEWDDEIFDVRHYSVVQCYRCNLIQPGSKAYTD